MNTHTHNVTHADCHLRCLRQTKTQHAEHKGWDPEAGGHKKMASCATSAPTEKIKTPETCELFSAYLAQSQEGDCHEREETASSFLWRTVLRDNELWNIGQLEDCEFFFFLGKKTCGCLFFPHFLWTLTQVEVDSLSKVQKFAGFHAAQVYTQCLFCGVFVHFVNLSGCSREHWISAPSSFTSLHHLFLPLCCSYIVMIFIIFYHIVLFFYTYIYV